MDTNKRLQILSVAAVVEATGASPNTVRRWLKDGTIPGAVRLGPRKLGLPVAAFEVWLASRAIRPVAPAGR